MQLLEIYWRYLPDSKKYIPIMKYIESTGEIKKVELPDFEFHAKFSNEKYCIGYYSEEKYYSCPEHRILLNRNASQCESCENLEGFKNAYFMNRAPNDSMKKFLEQKHHLYLAYFEPGIIKVGTVIDFRKCLRLIEQDALIYTFIGESNGYNILKIEKYISKNFGISENVKANHKLKYISQYPDLAKASSLLSSCFQSIKSRMKDEKVSEYNFKINEEFVMHNIINEVYFPQKYQLELEELNLAGRFKGLRGRYLILENNHKDYIFDINFLIGRSIEYIDNYTYNEEIQLNLL